MWTKIARLILRYRVFFLTLIGAITIFMAFQAQKAEMSYKYVSILPRQDTTYLTDKKYKELFGEEGTVMVLGIKKDDFFTLPFLNKWLKLGQDLQKLEGVESVLSAGHCYNLTKNKALKRFNLKPVFPDSVGSQHELDSLRTVFEGLPFYKGQLWNTDKNAYLMALGLNKEMLQSKERKILIGEVKKIAETFGKETGVKVHYSGLPYIRVATAKMLEDELQMFVFLALLVTASIMYVFFRSFKVVMFSLLVVGIGVIWAMGFMGIFGYKITMITAMIPPLLIVIGIPNSVFLLNKYHYEYRKHGNKIKALHRVIRKIGNATFLTNLTTASGFATFIITRSPILVEFGVVASLNILCLYFLSIILIPCIFSFLDPPKARHIKHLDQKWMGAIVNRLVRISLGKRNYVYGITIGLLAVGIWGMSQVRILGYMVDDLPQEHEIYTDLKFFESSFNGLMPLKVVVDAGKPNGVLKSSTLRKMDQLQNRLEKYSQLSRPISLVEGVKFSRQAYFNGKEKHYKLPNSQERNFILRYVGNVEGSGNNQIVSSFMDSLRQVTQISYQVSDVSTSEMEDLYYKIKDEVKEVFKKDASNVHVVGGSVIHFLGTKYLINNLFMSLAFAVVLIASFMALMFHSKRMVMVALIPNLIPLIMTAAIMGFFGIPLKTSTILVFSIAFGISVDDTIHFLAKYRQDLSETGWSIRASVVMALKETGVSMIYTSIILFFGFGIFSISSFGGIAALGLLVSVTLLIAMFSNLVILPSLLLTLERAITTKSFKEPLLQIYDEEEDIELDALQIEPRRGQRKLENAEMEV